MVKLWLVRDQDNKIRLISQDPTAAQTQAGRLKVTMQFPSGLLFDNMLTNLLPRITSILSGPQGTEAFVEIQIGS